MKYKEIKNKFRKKGLRAIANELNIPLSSLQEWIIQISFLEETKGGSHKYRLRGGGRNPNTLSLEDELIIWKSEQRRLGIPINTNTIILKLLEKDNKTLLICCLCFLARYSFSIRNVTHVGQKLKLNAKQQYFDFYKMLYNLRNQIGDYENYQNLFNMKETPIWFEMASKTSDEKIGEK